MFQRGTLETADASESRFTAKEVSLLVRSVHVKGWSEKRKKLLFSDPALVKRLDMISLNATEPIILSHEKYGHYFEKSSIQRAKDFARYWRTRLAAAERKYKVDKEVIVAILLVETQLGVIKGDYPVVSVFASLFVDANTLLTGKTQIESEMKKRIERKKDWAKSELEALLKIQLKYGTPVLQLRGSYAGAFGMSQFLPSSYLNDAVSPLRTKSPPDLNDPLDAIYSVGNYLKGRGYLKSRKWNHEKNRKAVHAYNNSNVYVDTILGVAKLMKAND